MIWIEPMIERSGTAAVPPDARLDPDHRALPRHADARCRPRLHQRRSPHRGSRYAHPIESPDYDAPDVVRPFFEASAITPCGSTASSGYRLDLHDFRSSGVRRGRGHATGELWNPDGTHVATVTQEVLLQVAR